MRKTFRAWGQHSILVLHEKNNSFIVFLLSSFRKFWLPSIRANSTLSRLRNVCTSARPNSTGFAINGSVTNPLSRPLPPAATTKLTGLNPPTISWPVFCRTASRSTFPCWPMNWPVHSTFIAPAPPSPPMSDNTFHSWFPQPNPAPNPAAAGNARPSAISGSTTVHPIPGGPANSIPASFLPWTTTPAKSSAAPSRPATPLGRTSPTSAPSSKNTAPRPASTPTA